MKKLILTAFALLMCCISQAQIQTITVGANSQATTNNGAITLNGTSLTVPTNSFATLKALVGDGAGVHISTQGTIIYFGNNTSYSNGSLPPLVVAGPASIQIIQAKNYNAGAFATFEVEPGLFPPGKTATVGSYAGNVQVTMQMSTDLVNWTAATNGIVYTNSPAARFFRIQLNTNPSP